MDDLVLQHKRLRSSDAQEVEVLIVDNNSFDETKETIYKYLENTGLSIKFFNEEHFGLSAARNLAIKKAQGDLLAFIHDDINIDDDWLREAFKIANNCKDREIGVYGGRVIPMWQDKLPKWLNLQDPYRIDQEVFHGHSFGDEEQFYPFASDFGNANFPSGINVFIRREVFENCGYFREDLGPSAGGGFDALDDQELFEYFSTLKIPMLYIPQCIVFHPINSQHMSLQNVRRWYYKNAQAKYWIAHTDRMQRPAPRLFAIPNKYRKWVPRFMRNCFKGVPLYIYAKFLVLAAYWLVSYLGFNKQKTNWISYRVSEAIGEMEASALIDERSHARKFSFRDRLASKGFERELINQ